MSIAPSLVSLPKNIHFKRSNVRTGRLFEDCVRTLLKETHGTQNVVGNGIEDGKTKSGCDFIVMCGSKRNGIEVKFWNKVGEYVVKWGFFKDQILDRFTPILNTTAVRILIVFGRLPKNSYQFRRMCREEGVTLIHLPLPQDELDVVSTAFALCDDEGYERILPLLVSHYASRFREELTSQLSRAMSLAQRSLFGFNSILSRVFPIIAKRCRDSIVACLNLVSIRKPPPSSRAPEANHQKALMRIGASPERIWRGSQLFSCGNPLKSRTHQRHTGFTVVVAATKNIIARKSWVIYGNTAVRNPSATLASLSASTGDFT